MKAMPISSATVALLNPSKPQRAAPCQSLIAAKAYEIWQAKGQLPGQDQQHWFEAERQLQQA